MSDTLIKRRIHRIFSTGKAEELDDEIVKEHRLQIRLDGKDFVQAALSPNLLEEFVLGFLRTRGLISGIEDLVSLEIAGTTASAVRNSQSRQTIPELTLLESTGSRNIDRDSAFRLAASISPSSLRVSSKVVADGVAALAEMPIYKRTGGTHCAILFSDKGEPLFSAEDIGRHNAVDKVVGGALKKGVDFNQSWLAVSGRLPADERDDPTHQPEPWAFLFKPRLQLLACQGQASQRQTGCDQLDRSCLEGRSRPQT